MTVARGLGPRMRAREPAQAEGQPRIAVRLRSDPAAERAALVAGLRARPASIAPKHFYDDAGCALFARICTLPEYYLTRTEAAIFAAHRASIARAAGRGRTLVDLGAGDCAKAEGWLADLAPRRYIGVDIAAGPLAAALAGLAERHPAVAVEGVVADFTQGLDLEHALGGDAVTFFYPGSSIGNFTPQAAAAFLALVADHCAARPGSGLLVGVDLRKDPARLLRAYDDASGVTAAFNRNVLAVVNRLAGADFVPARFAHVACYDEAAGRVSMHLEAARTELVSLDGIARRFAKGERIHTEDSFKYERDGFAATLRAAGFAGVDCWQDAAGDFAVFYASRASRMPPNCQRADGGKKLR